MSAPTPLLIAIDMGYGHLRAAHALADALGVEVLHADRPPLADLDEQRRWAAARRLYERASRASQLRVVGRPLRALLDRITTIPPLHPRRDQSAPSLLVRLLTRALAGGSGRGLIERLERTGEPLLTTYFAPALIADRAGCGRRAPLYCVVTDVDLSRAWVPPDPAATTINYLVPSRRALRRLRAYGVPRDRVEVTGFPLPGELLGGPDLKALRANLAGRLVRLDPKRTFRQQFRNEIETFLGELPAAEERRPPLVVFAVGGAGAQAGLARRVIRGLAPRIEQGIVRLCLVAGVRSDLAGDFERWLDRAGLARYLGGPVEILCEATAEGYFRRFNRVLAGADVLWTKPSELSFFAALGVPLILSWPVGVHERYNRRWALEHGAALKQRDPRHVGSWLAELLGDGTLAGAAWSGFLRLPKFGLYQIVERLERDRAGRGA